MSYTVTMAGSTFTLPDTDETAWGTDIKAYFQAIPSSFLQKSSGSFALTQNLNFGTNYGILATFFSTSAPNPALAGTFRLANSQYVTWRNAANSADVTLRVDSSDKLMFNGVEVADLSSQQTLEGKTIDLEPNLIDPTKTNVLLNLRNSAVASDAAIAYSKLNLTGSIVNADVNASAGIVYSKLNLTGSIVNADISNSANIAYSKLDLTGGIVISDLNPSINIPYSNLDVAGSIVNSDINASAAIEYSKLDLTASIAVTDLDPAFSLPYASLDLTNDIVNADINVAAAIAGTKIDPDFGTQTIETSGDLVLKGASHSVTLSADPSANVSLALPTTQGSVGQSLVQSSAGQLGWATLASALAENNVFVGNASSDLVQVDTALVGDIAAHPTNGLTIKSGVIVNADISNSAAIDQSKIANLTTDLAGKEPVQIKGSISTSTTGVTIGNGTNATVGPNVTVNVATASAGATGLLTNTDWSTFNGKQAALGFTPVNKAGDTMTGVLTMDDQGMQLDLNGVTPSTPPKGRIWWDDTNKTMAVKMDATGVTLQVGQEMHVLAYNNTGVTITNGSLVYISGIASGYPTISLARANTQLTSDGTIGMATHDILNTQVGYVTTTGTVNDIKTDVDCQGVALAAGDLVYLCPITAGGFVKTIPVGPYHNVKIGTVLEANASTGKIRLNIDTGSHLAELHDTNISGLADRDILEYDASTQTWRNYINPATYTKEPTGFADPTNIGVAYDSVNRTITLTHGSGTIVYYINGIRYTRASGYVSPAHDAPNSSYFLAFAAGDVPTWTTSFSGFNDGAYVAYINYGATDKFAIRECHGLMSWQSWQEFHETVGTYRSSGGSVPGTSWAANTNTVAAVTPVIDVAVIKDEDLPTTVPAGIDGGTYTRLHFSNGLAVFTTGSTLPYPTSGGNPQYNQNPISGTALTAIAANNTWFNVYGILVPVTSDATSQAYRHVWLTGQATYTSQALAQAEDFRSLQLGNLTTIFTEFMPYVRVTYRRDGAYNNTSNGRLEAGAITYLSGSRSSLVSVSGFNPTDHNSLTNRTVADSHPATAVSYTPTNHLVSTDVQAAITEAALNYRATVSWTGAGPYTMAITAATHGKGPRAIVQVMSQISGDNYENAAVNIAKDITTGDVTISSTVNFVGIIEIG